MKKLLLLAILFVSLTSCNSNKVGSENSSDEPIIDSMKIVDSIMAADAAKAGLYGDTEKSPQNKKRFDSLVKYFNVSKDEFKDYSYYYSKKWSKNWPNRKALYCYLSSSGTIFLVSNYYADDWIFHTYFEVLIGDKKYESSNVETFNPKHKTENSGGYVWENLTYTEPSDITIIKEIANNQSAKIKVRLQGKQYYSDFTLSENDKKAFKDCWNLYQTLNSK